MRYNDSRDGTDKVDRVLEKYRAAWDTKGMVSASGLFVDMWMVKQDFIVPPQDIGWTAWFVHWLLVSFCILTNLRAGTFMNAWNHDLVINLSAKQLPGFVTNIDGRVRLQPPAVANHFRKLTAEAASTSDSGKLQKAIDLAKADIAEKTAAPFPYTKPCFGYVTQWLSELGQTSLLDGLLAYADEALNPTWDDGGLYYPRNDTPFVWAEKEDVEGVRWTHISPFCGNAAIGYSRLNVTDGQRIMYEKPWTREHLARTPYIDGLEFGGENGVSVLRGLWDGENEALILTIKGWDFEGKLCPEKVSVEPAARQLPAGKWAVYVNGKFAESVEMASSADSAFRVKVDVKRGEDVDVVFIRDGANGPVHS